MDRASGQQARLLNLPPVDVDTKDVNALAANIQETTVPRLNRLLTTLQVVGIAWIMLYALRTWKVYKKSPSTSAP